MAWYAASIILFVNFKDGKQDKFPVWENVVLVEAEDEGAALSRAELLGRAEAGDADGSMTWDGRPASWCFAGIRKLLTVSNPRSVSNEPADGAEVSYSEFIVENQRDLDKLVRGQEVKITYCE
jgi:hypothetical protein